VVPERALLLHLVGGLIDQLRVWLRMAMKQLKNFDDYKLSLFRRRKLVLFFSFLISSNSYRFKKMWRSTFAGRSEDEGTFRMKAEELLEMIGLSHRWIIDQTNCRRRNARVAIARALVTDHFSFFR